MNSNSEKSYQNDQQNRITDLLQMSNSDDSDGINNIMSFLIIFFYKFDI